jgi:outer membrane lipoprotein-sorting protein
MEQKKKILGIFAILICSSIMMSGCTQQNSPTDQNHPSNETLQQILNKAITTKTVYYEINISLTMNGSLVQNTTVKIWQKTPYLKEEVSNIQGNITTNITYIKNSNGTFRYDTVQNKYISVPSIVIPQPSTGEMANDLLNNQTIINQSKEELDGKTTTFIQYIPVQGGNSTITKIWIWNEKGLPLKIQKTTTKQGIITTTDYQYSNYSFSDISDSTFDIS